MLKQTLNVCFFFQFWAELEDFKQVKKAFTIGATPREKPMGPKRQELRNSLLSHEANPTDIVYHLKIPWYS